MNKKYAIIAAMLGMLTVILGAFAAHGLAARLTEVQLHSFETGVRYQMYHALALLVLSLHFHKWQSAWAHRTALCWILGMLLFSGSLYALSVRDLLAVEALSVLGPITPIGGMLLIAGWACCIAAAASSEQIEQG